MQRLVSLSLAFAGLGPVLACTTPAAPEPTMKRMTPILTVEEIEPCLSFWIERLEFEKTLDVPEGERLGFAMLQRDGIEIMLQTRSSVASDNAALARELADGKTLLYLEVADFERTRERLEGCEIVVPERTTFYGAQEIFVREPGGHVIGFAKQPESPAE